MLRPTLLILPLALLAACSSTQSEHAANSQPAPSSTALAVDQLDANHWRLSSATTANGQALSALSVAGQKPVQLDFDQGNVAIHANCNHLRGSYTLKGNTLAVGPMMSTMIGCPPALHDQDRAIGDLLEKPLTVQALDARQMVLRAADGSLLRFAGEPTAETRYGGPGKTVFWEVAAQTKPCSHPLIDNMQCLQVREIVYDANGIKQGTPGEFTHFYGQIEGYTHQPGVRNVLRLKRFEVKNPPADASDAAYVLDMTVETELVDR